MAYWDTAVAVVVAAAVEHAAGGEDGDHDYGDAAVAGEHDIHASATRSTTRC